MPKNTNTTLQQRNARSNSINEIKSEIISAFKVKLSQVSTKLDTLIKRIKVVEESVCFIQRNQDRQGAEIDSLKEALKKATAKNFH